MFDSENSELSNHLETSANINIRSVVLAEWNMNNPDNIHKIGNFRYRPTEDDSDYKTLPTTFSYTGAEIPAIANATYSDTTIDGGLADDNVTPLTFTSVKEKERLLYSLEDCFARFRPRSGINKLRYFDNRYTHFDNKDMGSRPRYYMGHKNDLFKYWTSYRVESGIERGISKFNANEYTIDDTVPFVVYKNELPTNRIIIKVQTNVGSTNLGTFYDNSGSYSDPFFGDNNKTVPRTWTLQYLEKNGDIYTWKDAYSADDPNIIEQDGYLELAYGLIVPNEYSSIFKIKGQYSARELLPVTPEVGSSYLVTSSETDIGLYYVYTGNGAYLGYTSFTPQYGWYKKTDSLTDLLGVITELVDTPSYSDAGKTKYREFEKICGLRLVVETMNQNDCSFDLIELSPRLCADLSDMTTSYSVKKTASDLGSTGMPVGQLLASNGSLSLFDYQNAFNENNPDSILSSYTLSKNIQVKFYEGIVDVPIYDNDIIVSRSDYYIPIKTLYADGFPQIDKETRAVSIPLRDLFFYFESTIAPQVLIQNTSVSYAVSLLLDSIGFSNYTFKRNPLENTEPIIPFFFVPPDKSVAEILQDIAVSTQTSMFFDEYNNFVLMSKNYIMPTEAERATDLVLRGSVDYGQKGIIKNSFNAKPLTVNISTSTFTSKSHNLTLNTQITISTTGTLPTGIVSGTTYYARDITANTFKLSTTSGGNAITLSGSQTGTHTLSLKNPSTALANIVAVSASNNNIFNDGVIAYNTRYIQKTYGSIKQASLVDQDQTWVYKPVLLWEVAGTEKTKSQNDDVGRQSAYSLSAIPLNTELSSSLPTVSGGQVINNTMNFGEGIYWISRYNGYFFANGEIIKYDAVQYNIPGQGNQWITSAEEYNNYFSKIPFNGKLYPTGLVRIFSEPNYQVANGVTTLKAGAVAKHGRGQFGTVVTSHPAGLNSYWTNKTNTAPVKGVAMDSKYLFGRNTNFLISNIFTKKDGSVFLNDKIEVQDATNMQPGYFVEIYQGTGEVQSNNTKIMSITNNENANDIIVIDPPLKQPIIDNYTDPVTGDFITNTIRIINRAPATPSTIVGPAGVSENNNILARKASRTGVIKNFMTSSKVTETQANTFLSTQTGTIQSSAFVLTGPSSGIFPTGTSTTLGVDPINFLSYVYKPLTDKFSHFGTRMRIIGRIDGTQDKQSPAGSSVYYSVAEGTQIDKTLTVSGGSGGIGLLLNPETNNGYYLELIGLTQNNISNYFTSEQFDNVIFYKLVQRSINRLAISAVSRASGTVTITTINDHGFQVNDPIVIGGVDNGTTLTNFDGSFTVATVPTTKTFTYLISNTASQSDAAIQGKPTAYINVREDAIPVKLWGGTTQIIVDDGTFVGQERSMAQQNPTVYDIAVEYEQVGAGGKTRRFYIYLNGKLISTVDDPDPLPVYNNMAMFVRGSARCMFENIYAVANNYSQNTSTKIDTPALSNVFGDQEVTVNESFKKYAMNGLVQSTYLSGINPSVPPQYNIYFDEFGTIMREAAHFNIKYDKAYPALYAKLSPTFNNVKGYTVSGFMAGAYGAEFLIFNNTDTVLNLDEGSGNYLRIQGATFTQQSQHNYTVDEHFEHTGDFSNIEIGQGSDVGSYTKAKQDYQDIKNSRLMYGKKQFSLNAPYIQDSDSAKSLMSWMISKILKPRKSVGLKVFGLPNIQLGDIVEIDYKSKDANVDQVALSGSRFVVYDIEYSRSVNGPDTVLYVSEVK